MARNTRSMEPGVLDAAAPTPLQPADASAAIQRDNSGTPRVDMPTEGASNFASVTRDIRASFQTEN